MSVREVFDAAEQAAMLEALGEPVRLHWPAWPQPRDVDGVVDEAFTDEGRDVEVSVGIVGIDLLTSSLPAGATKDQICTDLTVQVMDRGYDVRPIDVQDLGGGASTLVCRR